MKRFIEILFIEFFKILMSDEWYSDNFLKKIILKNYKSITKFT